MDEVIVRAIVRFGCLYLATELCKVANAFDRPERVLELAREFERHCCPTVPGGEPSAPEQPKAAGKGLRAGKEDPRKFLG